MNESKRQRNRTLDMLRLFAAFLVVGLHCGYPSFLGGINLALSRVAVPFFFLLSGYFCYAPDGEQRKRRAKRGFFHLLWLTLWGFLVTWVYFLSLYNFNFFEMIAALDLSPSSWLKLLLLNDPSGFFMLLDPMWFLHAMLYAYGVLWLIEALRLKKSKYVLMAILLAALFVLNELLTYFGVQIPREYYRNFLVTGLSFLLLGMFMHEYERFFTARSDLFLWIAIALGALYCVGMQWLLLPDFYRNSCEIYLGTIVMALSIVTLGVKHPNAPKLLSEAGKNYSLIIYIAHPIVMSLLRRAFIATEWFSMPIVQLFYAPVVFLLALGFSILWKLLLDWVHKLRKRA